MKHLGDFDTSAVIYGKFTSYQPSTGAAFLLGGSPALSVYKDNSTTQTTTGVTLTASFDSVVGLNHFAIDTSADGTFYSAGSFFEVIITTGTIDSVSVVGGVVGSFTLRKDSSLKPATAGRTLVVDAAGLTDANAVKVGPSGSGTAQTARDIGASVLLSSGSGAGQLDFTSGVVKSNLAQILGTALTETAGLLAGGFKKFFNVASPTLTCLDINQTGDSYARLGAPAGASVSADIAAVTAAASDPWTTALPGAYSSGTAGKILADAGTQVTAVKAKTDSLTFTTAGYVDANALKGGSWKKNTAKPNYPFIMVDLSGLPRTGLTVTATRRIDGGAFAACTNAVTEVANGWYTIDFSAADLNGDTIAVRLIATGAQDRCFSIPTTG